MVFAQIQILLSRSEWRRQATPSPSSLAGQRTEPKDPFGTFRFQTRPRVLLSVYKTVPLFRVRVKEYWNRKCCSFRTTQQEDPAGPGQGGGSAPSLGADPCSWAASGKRAADRGPPRPEQRCCCVEEPLPVSFTRLFRSLYGMRVSTLSFLSSEVGDALWGEFAQSSVILLDATLQEKIPQFHSRPLRPHRRQPAIERHRRRHGSGICFRGEKSMATAIRSD